MGVLLGILLWRACLFIDYAPTTILGREATGGSGWQYDSRSYVLGICLSMYGYLLNPGAREFKRIEYQLPIHCKL